MEIYEQLWEKAVAAFAAGRPETDRHLSDRANDRRRGVSLIFRPSLEVRERVKDFLAGLAAEFPGQYFYAPEELHVTVLTLIHASELWRNEIRDLARFRAILKNVLRPHESFEVEFSGITAAPNAVMIQGFPCGEALANIRNQVRDAFAGAGFAQRLDRRYRTTTAHLTVMRFASPDANWQRLLAALTANRATPFGTAGVNRLQLVLGDWYGSVNNLRVLEEFELKRKEIPH